MTRPCGCTADPAVFGHVCGLGPWMSAEIQDRQLLEAVSAATTPGGNA